MKKQWMKCAVMGAAATLVLAGPVSAQETRTEPNPPPEEISWYAYEAAPRLTCFYFVDCSISRENSVITCSAALAPRDGYDFNYTISLEKSKDADSWTLVDSWAFSGSGDTVKATKKTVSKGYYYRVTVSATGIDSDGTEYGPAIVYSANLDYLS